MVVETEFLPSETHCYSGFGWARFSNSATWSCLKLPALKLKLHRNLWSSPSFGFAQFLRRKSCIPVALVGSWFLVRGRKYRFGSNCVAEDRGVEQRRDRALILELSLILRNTAWCY